MESTEWGDTGSICTQWVKNTFRIRPMSKWVTLWSHHLIIVDLNSRVAKFSKISFDVKKFFFFFLLRKNSIYSPASAVCCFCFEGKERKKKAKSYSSKINRQVFNLLCHFKMKKPSPAFSVFKQCLLIYWMNIKWQYFIIMRYYLQSFYESKSSAIN